MITNDDDLGSVLDEISISIQHQTPLYEPIVERMIPDVPNPTQDSHIPSFVPKIVEGEKIPNHEIVLGLLALLIPLVPINDDCKIESPKSPCCDWGWKPCALEFKACSR